MMIDKGDFAKEYVIPIILDAKQRNVEYPSVFWIGRKFEVVAVTMTEGKLVIQENEDDVKEARHKIAKEIFGDIFDKFRKIEKEHRVEQKDIWLSVYDIEEIKKKYVKRGIL